MTRLIVCCDGTWNTPDQREDGAPSPTNVVKFFNALAPDANGEEQRRYYHPGVGTDGSWWDRLAGGGLGEGLDRNVQSGYRWLATNYAPGDSIYLLGFSRGAYTARSIGGMIARCGLMNLAPRDGLTDAGTWAEVAVAFHAYRAQKELTATPERRFHNAGTGACTRRTTEIHFVGVWDTVGALGIPDDFALLNLLDDPDRHRFHDAELSRIVLHARHAVAIDERRQSFGPTLWTNADHADMRQVWFPGVHGDVGGGYARSALSDAALLWMIDEAEAQGLAFRPGIRSRLAADPLGVLHDSLTGIFRRLKTRPRAVPRLGAAGASGELHQSAVDRHEGASFDHADYWANRALDAGRPVTCDVFANQPWNYTGLYLDAGQSYRFDAAGEWIDGSIACGPGGTRDGTFQAQEFVHVAASLLGEAETLFKRLSRNAQADFWLTRREEAFRWFALVGVIANGLDGNHEVFRIGDGTRFTPTAPGYLYAFANDAWMAYGNNRGSVRLTVRAETPADAEPLPVEPVAQVAAAG